MKFMSFRFNAILLLAAAWASGCGGYATSPSLKYHRQIHPGMTGIVVQ
jgi:hypothetical protein